MNNFRGVGLVRDKNGNPKIDNPTALHPLQVAMLTTDERVAHNLWGGAFAHDAQGFKRMTKTAEGYQAVDPLVAASTIYDGMKTISLPKRIDVPAGGTIAEGA